MLGESAAASRFQTGGILEAYCPAPVHHCLLQYCFSPPLRSRLYRLRLLEARTDLKHGLYQHAGFNST